MLQKILIVLLAVLGCTLNISALPLIRARRGVTSRHLSTITVTEGEDISISCIANGTYNPAFHWLFKDEYLEQGPLDTIARNLISPPHLHYMTKVEANLYIKNAKVEHSGKYTCIADSLTKRVTKSFTVNVEKKSDKQKSEVKVVTEKTPMIYQWTSSIMQVKGSTMYVVCRATQGKTTAVPKIRWTMNDVNGNVLKDITANDDTVIHSNGDLEVRNVGFDFHFWEGSLTCNAINDDGHHVAQKPVWVYITGNSEETTN